MSKVIKLMFGQAERSLFIVLGRPDTYWDRKIAVPRTHHECDDRGDVGASIIVIPDHVGIGDTNQDRVLSHFERSFVCLATTVGADPAGSRNACVGGAEGRT